MLKNFGELPYSGKVTITANVINYGGTDGLVKEKAFLFVESNKNYKIPLKMQTDFATSETYISLDRRMIGGEMGLGGNIFSQPIIKGGGVGKLVFKVDKSVKENILSELKSLFNKNGEIKYQLKLLDIRNDTITTEMQTFRIENNP